MKVILSSLKTLNWFKALVAVSACASLILFHSCRKDELKSELNMEQKDFQDLQGMNFRPRSGSISNSLKIYFGPEKFIAGSTKPFLESQSLSNPDFENYMDFFKTSIRSVDYNSTYVGLGETNNNHGFSVRCVRN